MAMVNETQSLEQINYKSRIKFYFYPLIALFLFMAAFINYYPVGEELKAFMQKNLRGTGCNPDFDQINIEWLMPKLVVTDLMLPAACLNQAGEPLRFSFLKVHFNFINFAPLGVPFKIETEVNSQPISFYFVQGFGERLIRMKDQALALTRLQPLLGGKVKLAGNMTVDLNALLTNNNALKELSLKAQSKDLQIPPQTIEGFTTPVLKVNDFYLEADSENPPKILVQKLIVGDPDSPMRANFKGTIVLQQGNIAFSPLSLAGEVAFSPSFKETVPLVDLLFQNYTQKDGFYQIRIGGTLGQPKLTNP